MKTKRKQILPETCVRLGLSRILDIWLIEKFLNAKENLLNGNRRAPVLFLVKQ